MYKIILFGIWLVLLVGAVSILTCQSHADFHASDRPTVSFNGGGLKHLGNFDVYGMLPLNFIDGYIGAHYTHDGIPDDETSRTHLRARIEGGHTWGWFGIRAYGRYGRESVMLQKGLYHGGFNLEATLYTKDSLSVKAGIGTWAERQKLLDAYMETATDENGVDFGPRGHLSIAHENTTLLSAILIDTQGEYQIRNNVHVEIPVFRVLFFEQVFINLSAWFDYHSETKHIEIESVNWGWSHRLGFKF